MFRLPAWISESRGSDKAVDGVADTKMASASLPVVEILARGLPKRKRCGSDDDAPELPGPGAEDAKRWKPNGDVKLPVLESSRVRDAIESQFSLEILLKHDELRLVNQELAKCQAALEQLRRCHLIPYPSAQGTPDAMYNTSNGTGPALRQGDHVPAWAPPYGVADGPYTRHYAKWLIPDPMFDGIVQDQWYGFEGSRASRTAPEGRSTRNSFTDINSAASKARTQRGSSGQKLQALSSGYPVAKERAGPCVLKRAEDGQMVKLVCNDCQRENFSSTQGFINHCRIAHRKEYKSHEEAAIACGQPIDIDETGGIVGEEKTVAAPSNGLVHPFVRDAPVDRQAYVDLLSRIDASMQLFKQGQHPGATCIPGLPGSSIKAGSQTPSDAGPRKNLVPSADTPYLSKLMQNKGVGANLAEIVGEAKQHVDFEEYAPGFESDDGESPLDAGPGRFDGADSPLPAMRMPARTAKGQTPLGRPGSSKGVDALPSRTPGISPRAAYAVPVNTTPVENHDQASAPLGNDGDLFNHHDADGDLDMMGPSLVDLSPNTVASNNAPSLVSDDGEYDEGDEDAESSASEDEEEGSDVAEIDIEDGEGEKEVPRTVLRNRSGGGAQGMRLRKEDKHVTFVSPVKETRSRK
jgi:ADA HAT complex component 1